MRLRQICITLALVAAACGGGTKQADTTSTTAPAETKTLYDRLGGRDAIVGVVSELVTNILADTRINAMFANADVKNLKTKLVDQICQATGGPCTYTGKTMKDTHAAMGVKEADFDALVDDLVKALEKFNVPEKERTELLGVLGKMKGDIVTAP